VLRLGTQLKRALIFIHRWMGVAFCLLFFLWFSSGIVMMYWDYPVVSSDDRLLRSPALDGSKIKFSPAEAYARLGADLPPPRQVRLGTFDGRPAYKFGARSEESIVYADDGKQQEEFSSELTRRIAAAWTRQSPASAKEEDDVPEDQWTVSGEFIELRPLRKYTWPNGEEVYVSTVTGNVVQYTTSKSRLGAYLGPIPHWLYFTPLRRHGKEWSELVIAASGLAIVVALIGITVGVWMYSPSKRFNYLGAPSSLPYVGWKRWHSIFGLMFGILACTWAFSGMLSMDPFPQWQGEQFDEIGARVGGALRGETPQLNDFAAKSPQEAIAEAGTTFIVKELELTSFAREPIYLAYSAPNQTRIVPTHGKPFVQFDPEKILGVLATTARPATISEIRMVTEYEAYYLDRQHRLPLPAIFVQLNDSERSAYYIDPKTARIVESYNYRSRRNRWLYHGLHSINLPLLYKYRPTWDILVLSLMIGGTSLCVTSVVLAWKVLLRRRKPMTLKQE
jgi:hypothetical protein